MQRYLKGNLLAEREFCYHSFSSFNWPSVNIQLHLPTHHGISVQVCYALSCLWGQGNSLRRWIVTMHHWAGQQMLHCTDGWYLERRRTTCSLPSWVSLVQSAFNMLTYQLWLGAATTRQHAAKAMEWWDFCLFYLSVKMTDKQQGLLNCLTVQVWYIEAYTLGTRQLSRLGKVEIFMRLKGTQLWLRLRPFSFWYTLFYDLNLHPFNMACGDKWSLHDVLVPARSHILSAEGIFHKTLTRGTSKWCRKGRTIRIELLSNSSDAGLKSFCFQDPRKFGV